MGGGDSTVMRIVLLDGAVVLRVLDHHETDLTIGKTDNQELTEIRKLHEFHLGASWDLIGLLGAVFTELAEVDVPAELTLRTDEESV